MCIYQELLSKAYEIQISVYGDDDINCASTLTLIANAYTNMKKYEEALEFIGKVFALSDEHFGYKSESTAFAFIETAKINSLKGEEDHAIEAQKQAISILMDINFEKPEYIAEQYLTLSNYLEKTMNYEEMVDTLKKVSDIYQEVFGPKDKKVIKVKRQVSVVLLKLEKHQEALEELLETEDIEMQYYGENSIQTARTQKIIGTVFIMLQDHQEAQKYLMKAMKVFEDNGVKKTVNEIKEKLQVVKAIREKFRSELTE